MNMNLVIVIKYWLLIYYKIKQKTEAITDFQLE